jgi:hypothetical protein
VARADERWFVRKERRVMDRDQSRTDLRIELAILVLGLAGVVAIFVPFAYSTSPWGAVRWFVNPWFDPSSYRADSLVASLANTSLLLGFLLAPLISLLQL